jgi:hypothetical protein
MNINNTDLSYDIYCSVNTSTHADTLHAEY